MAPQPTYDPPHQQLGRLMVLARRRGLDFEAWWEEAVRPGRPLVMTNSQHPPVGAVRWPSDRNPRVEWLAAIVGTKEAWRRAFERETPTPQEAALSLLSPALDALAGGFDVGPAAGIEARGAVASAA